MTGFCMHSRLTWDKDDRYICENCKIVFCLRDIDIMRDTQRGD